MIEVRRFHGDLAWIQAIVADFSSTLALVPASETLRVCLAGGRSPEPVYQRLALLLAGSGPGTPPAILVPGDERVDATNAEDLNETMIHRAFKPALALGAASFYGWCHDSDGLGPFSLDRAGGGPNSAQAMMERMEALLATLARPGRPLFDVCYLGLGADGHTAGLFPGMPGLNDPALCLRGTAPSHPRRRVSLGYPALLSSGRTRFIIGGPGKELALARLMEGDPSCPAAMAATADTVVFVLA